MGPRVPQRLPFLGVTLGESLQLCLSFLGSHLDNQSVYLRGLLRGLIQLIPPDAEQAQSACCYL